MQECPLGPIIQNSIEKSSHCKTQCEEEGGGGGGEKEEGEEETLIRKKIKLSYFHGMVICLENPRTWRCCESQKGL